MASFNVRDAENYGGQGGGGFFSLRKDKEVAHVRFLYNSIDDVRGHSVHEVEIEGKKRYVNCIRDYGDPIDACPFCAAGMFTQVKYFVPLYNMDTKSIQTWERGKKFGTKLTSMCSRYPNTVTHTFEIERNGQPGDTQTTYEIYETGETEGIRLEDFEVPNPLGTIILNKSAEEMNTYLSTNNFGDEAPVKRDSNNAQSSNGGFTRRTPANDTTPRRQAF